MKINLTRFAPTEESVQRVLSSTLFIFFEEPLLLVDGLGLLCVCVEISRNLIGPKNILSPENETGKVTVISTF